MGGSKGDGGGMGAAEIAMLQQQQQAASSALMHESAYLQNWYAEAAEVRAVEREEQLRKEELERLRVAEVKKAEHIAEEESRESAMIKEAYGVDEGEQTGDIGDLNLDSVVIERPGYENLDERPE